jgi:hypothetical protein
MPRKTSAPIGRKRIEHEIAMQRRLATFVCLLLGVCCIGALTIFYLQGFHAFGFNLPESLMHWIGAATIGSLGTLATIVFRAFFSSRAP